MSKVGIIVPVYKAEDFLHRCVDSILNQSHQDFELILVDDGSPDNSGAICDAYGAKDSRVHVIHQENQGVSAARNAGMDYLLAETRCQWVSFIDSDDWIHRDYLRILLTAVQEHQAQLAVCDMHWTETVCPDTAVQYPNIQALEPEAAYVEHFPKFLQVCCRIVHRSLLDGVRFPVGTRYEDAAVSHLLAFAAERIAVCTDKLYYYYFNENSFTRTPWTEGRLQVVKVHRDRLDFLREHGYEKAYNRELEEYAERITSNLLSLTDLLGKDEKYTAIFEDLREKLRDAVREAEELGAFRFDRERLMTYAYVSRGDLLWKTARSLQRIWRKVLNR